MKFLVSFAIVTAWLSIGSAGKPSTKYLPPNFAAVGAATAGSSHYPYYRNLNNGAAQLTATASPVHSSAHLGHNRATVQIPILRSDYSNDGSGNYNFGFETSNGIKRNEAGHFQGSWPGSGASNVAGSYSYTGDDGKLYSVTYKADGNGFHAEGDHLPTPPPIPREIQETLHLHQYGTRNQASPSYTTPKGATVHHSRAGSFSAASRHRDANVPAPNINYLPPQRGQGYNYGRHY